MSERKGDWIQTFTGKAFWPLDPRPEDVDIRDIAHALSMQCRYGGHAKHFYSVAEHCVTLSNLVPPEHAFAALMHDAAEAYIVDLPRPIKDEVVGYRELDNALTAMILGVFGLPGELPDVVKEYDARILNDERAALMATEPMPWKPCGEPLGARIFGFSPMTAEDRFLRRFRELSA